MPRSAHKVRTRDALTILDRMIGSDDVLREMVAREHLNAKVAQLIYASREKAGLTQAQLAALIGTKQPVIARLEDAEYQGHSLLMLQKIAAALGCKLEIRFAATGRKARAA
jgi:ribosome-binding protein aMBF1 (putative translation factor)